MKSTVRQKLGGNLSNILGVKACSSSSESIPPTLHQIRIHEIIPGRYQPRRIFNQSALDELSQSIKEQGVIQPIVVRKLNAKEYELIAGERRWRAAQIAGLNQIPALVCNIDNKSALAIGLIENIQRQDLNPIEEAAALRKLIDEFGITHEEVAKSVGRSRAAVSNMLRLLTLTPVVQEYLISKQLDVGHAKILMVFSSDEQERLASIIVDKKLSVRAAEKLAHSKKTNMDITKNEPEQHSRCLEWSKFLTKRLKSKVDVKLNKRGVGTLSIEINSEEDMHWFLEQLL